MADERISQWRVIGRSRLGDAWEQPATEDESTARLEAEIAESTDDHSLVEIQHRFLVPLPWRAIL